MKKMLTLLLACMLLAMSALAEEKPRTPAQIGRQGIELLMNAAAGTDYEAEKALRKGMTGEEKAQRRAWLAEYRAAVRPWLLAALCPEDVDWRAPESESLAWQQASVTEAPTDGERLAEAYAAFSQTEPGRAYCSAVEQAGANDADTALAITRRWLADWLDGLDQAELAAINGDYACWLYGPASPMDYPVVQGEDNSAYLHRLFSGERNACGTLFVDYRNLTDFQDPNTLIYGHHMRNGSMFGTLTTYGKDGYFDAHPYLLLFTQDSVRLVEIFAGYTTAKSDHCYDIAISGEEDFLAFVEEARRKSDFETTVLPTASDRLVTLSTCAYSFRNARYIIIGKLTYTAERTAVRDEKFENTENQ